MSGHSEPIVPTVLFVAEQRHPWKLAKVARLRALYHTPTTVRVELAQLSGGKSAQETKQQHHVYCIADDAAWGRVISTQSDLQTDLNALADGLRATGSYVGRLAEAGGIKKAPNPLSSTVISAPDPDTADEGSWFTNRLVPQITRRPITGHTPKMLRGPGHWAPDSETTWHARDHFVCPDDAAWERIADLIAAALARADNWQLLLKELGTYQTALADGRYARKETPMATSWPAPARPLRAVSRWGDTDIDSDLVGKLEKAGYHWEMAKQTPDGRWHHVVSSRNTALLRNDQVLLRRERLEALLAPALETPIEQQPTVQALDRAIRESDTAALAQIAGAIAGVPMMDQVEARETLDAMRSDLGQIELSLSSFRQRALDFADRQGWKALGYGGAAEAIQAELGAQYSKSYLSRLLQAAEIERVIELPIGNSVPESQLRPLAALDTPDQQRQAWQAATAAANGKPTAKAVQQAVEQIKPKPATCIRCGADRTQRHELTSYEAGLVPEYPGRAVTLCNRCIPELLLARKKATEPTAPFWQALSPAHPTAHLWTKISEHSYRSLCGTTINYLPAGSTDAGHCSSCTRATWSQNQTPAPEPTRPEIAPFAVQTSQGPREVVPLRTNGVLALHMSVTPGGTTTITHIATGKAVAQFARPASADAAYQQLITLDWTLTPEGDTEPALVLAITRIVTQFDDVDNYQLRRAKLAELEAQLKPAIEPPAAPQPSAWQEKQTQITPAQQADMDWYAGAEDLATKVLEYADHGSRHAAVTIALELASYLAGDDLAALAEALDDATYEALAAYRRDRTVPTLESEGSV